MEKEFIVEKALCRCSFGTAPAMLEVANQKKGKINGGKRTATTLTLGSNVFTGCGFGTCNKNPSSPVPCKAVVTRWSEGFSKLSVCGGAPLIPSSKGSCAMGTPDCISIIQSGQIPIPGTPQLRQAAKQHQADLDPLSSSSALNEHQIDFDFEDGRIEDEPIPQVVDAYFENENGEIIDRAAKEQTVYYVVKTQNMQGEKIDIDLSDSSLEFEHQSRVLANNLLTDVLIVSDTIKIKLKIISKQKRECR